MEHTITIEGLPEGWKAVAYRVPLAGDIFWTGRKILECHVGLSHEAFVIIQKTQPRRIVLEETGVDNNPAFKQVMTIEGTVIEIKSGKVWKQNKAPDIKPVGLSNYDPSSPNGYD